MKFIGSARKMFHFASWLHALALLTHLFCQIFLSLAKLSQSLRRQGELALLPLFEFSHLNFLSIHRRMPSPSHSCVVAFRTYNVCHKFPRNNPRASYRRFLIDYLLFTCDNEKFGTFFVLYLLEFNMKKMGRKGVERTLNGFMALQQKSQTEHAKMLV